MLTNPQQIKDVQTLRDQAMIPRKIRLDATVRLTRKIKENIKIANLIYLIFISLPADNGRLCMILDHNFNNETLGPFASVNGPCGFPIIPIPPSYLGS
jgi:hypothetical protein